MKAVALKSSSESAPARKQQKAVAHPVSVPSRSFQTASADGALIQRKSNCACGGGCPRCAGEPHHPNLQTKLTVSTPGDQYEQEADHVAEQVMRLPDSYSETGSSLSARPSSPSLQRRCAACEGEPRRDGDNVSRGDVLPGTGQSLAKPEQAFFEARFGHDFSGVRVHADSRAAELAQMVKARAYTVGGDIVFAAGQYAPGTADGRLLLAHELAHTIQQGAAVAASRSVDQIPAGGKRSPHVAQHSPAQRLMRLGSARIQRQTDATVEAGTGVGPAITAGTMKTDATIHNHAVTASDCFGRKGCNIVFQFDKAYKGDYNYVGGGGKTVRGVYVKISASYTSGTCGPCNELKLLQVFRYTAETGGKLETAKPTTDARKKRAGWDDKSAPSRGWMVDAQEDTTDPFYSSSWVGQPGSATTPAHLWDTPGHWADITNTGKDFNTCLICSPASSAATALACVNWGYLTDSSGVVAFKPATPVASCGSTQTAKDATARWESISGNKPTNIDFTKQPQPPPPPEKK